MRDAMEKRFLRVTRGSIVGGIRLGIFTVAFYGLQNLLAEKRGVHDIFNVVGAGSATASTFGLILPGSLRWRLRNAMLGSASGTAICFPLVDNVGPDGFLSIESLSSFRTTIDAKEGMKLTMLDQMVSYQSNHYHPLGQLLM